MNLIAMLCDGDRRALSPFLRGQGEDWTPEQLAVLAKSYEKPVNPDTALPANPQIIREEDGDILWA